MNFYRFFLVRRRISFFTQFVVGRPFLAVSPAGFALSFGSLRSLVLLWHWQAKGKNLFNAALAGMALSICLHVVSAAAQSLQTTPQPTFSAAEQCSQIMSLFDIDKDGKLSKDEYASGTVKMFQSLDRDDDIALEADELKDHKDEDLHRADVNKDSRLSITEILEHQESAFARKDLNHDGVLSRDEIECSINEKLGKKELR